MGSGGDSSDASGRSSTTPTISSSRTAFPVPDRMRCGTRESPPRYLRANGHHPDTQGVEVRGAHGVDHRHAARLPQPLLVHRLDDPEIAAVAGVHPRAQPGRLWRPQPVRDALTSGASDSPRRVAANHLTDRARPVPSPPVRRCDLRRTPLFTALLLALRASGACIAPFAANAGRPHTSAHVVTRFSELSATAETPIRSACGEPREADSVAVRSP